MSELGPFSFLFEKLHTTHYRHREVEQDEVDCLVAIESVQSFNAILSFRHTVSLRTQELDHRFANPCVIFDNQEMRTLHQNLYQVSAGLRWRLAPF